MTKHHKKSTPSNSAPASTSNVKMQLQQNQQQNEIDELKKQVCSLTNTIVDLKKDMTLMDSRLEVSNHVNSTLQRQLEDLQQYTRRHSLIIDGIKVKQNEKVEEVENEVKRILLDEFKVDENELKLEFDKAHRIGKVQKDNKQPVIVRFKSHSFRANTYADRKRFHQNKKNENVKFKLRVCLTSQRRNLLALMNSKLENEKVEFCYANINGNLKVRLKEEVENKKVIDIKTEADIDALLNKLNDEEL